MKKSTRVLLVIILSLLLIAISVPKLFGGVGYHYDDADLYSAGGCEISREVGKIEVDWVAGKVKIERHDGEGIILSEGSSRTLKKAEKMHWLLDGDTLYVKYARSGKRVNIRADKELTLLLPESLQLEEIVICGVSAAIEADLPQARKVDIQTVSGGVDAALCRTEDVRVNSVSGDVLLRCADACQSIEAESVSGDVTLQLPESAGFTAQVESVSGRIGGSLAGNAGGEKTYTRGSGECDIHMESVSGDLQLEAFVR